MAVFRDFDYPIRINGDLTLPSSYNLSVGGNVTVTGSISGATINATSNLQEAGTNLSAKYLGLTAKASDSDKLDNLDSISFMRADDNTSTTGTLTVSGGTLTMNNATSSMLNFSPNGYGAPAANGLGVGTKIRLWDETTQTNYGIGIDTGSVWYSSYQFHKWYTQNGVLAAVPTVAMTLDGSGSLSLNGSLSATGVSILPTLQTDLPLIYRNKWQRQYIDVNKGVSTYVPKLADFAGNTFPTDYVADSVASVSLPLKNADFFLTRFTTWVYVAADKTITGTLLADDGAALYVNSQLIITANNAMSASTAINLKAGWSQIDVLFYEHTGAQAVTFNFQWSAQVDYMTAYPQRTLDFWHAGNTGSGSGSNVDMVDGYHLNQGVQTTDSPTFADLTLTGALTTNGTIYSATTVNLTTSAGWAQSLNLGSLNINSVYANSTPPTNGIYSLGGIVSGNDGVFAGRIYVKNGPTDNNGGIELGRTDAIATTPYIDFHSSGNNIDHDVRIIANGGNTTVGNGTLNIFAANLQVNSNNVYHAGNFSPSSFLTTGLNQSTGSGFTVQGTMYLGVGPSTSGDLVIRDGAAANVIHLDGNNSGKVDATSVKAYIAGNGNADFKGTVTVNTLGVTSTALVVGLNAETINSVKEVNLTKNISSVDGFGYGVYSGLAATEQTPSPTMSVYIGAGVVYTDTGRRIVFNGGDSVMMVNSPTYDRIGVIYVYGSKDAAGNPSGNLEGTLNAVMGAAVASPVEPSIPIGATKLATVYVKQNIGTILNADITDARKWRAIQYSTATNTLNLNATNLAVGGFINEGGVALTAKYVQLGTSSTPVNNALYGRTTITSTGVGSANYYLKVTDGTNTLGLTPREINASSDLWINSPSSVNITSSVSVNSNGYLKASKNATKVTIPQGSTSVTWTHNYGTAQYAVAPMANSAKRHVYYQNLFANSIDICIDEAADQAVDVLVILMPY